MWGIYFATSKSDRAGINISHTYIFLKDEKANLSKRFLHLGVQLKLIYYEQKSMVDFGIGF